MNEILVVLLMIVQNHPNILYGLGFGISVCLHC